MRKVQFSAEVEAALTPATRSAIVDPKRMERVRCARCRKWLGPHEEVAISLIASGAASRAVATHPACMSSRYLRDDSLPATEILPAEGLTCIGRAVLKELSPRAMMLVEFTGSMVSPAGPTDLMDINLSGLLARGFVAPGAIEGNVPLVPGWHLAASGDRILIAAENGTPFFEGDPETPETWLEEIDRSGRVLVIAGSLLGIRDEDPIASLGNAVQAGRVVAGIVEAERRVPKVSRNFPCPCGSGEKYKFCHGANPTASGG